MADHDLASAVFATLARVERRATTEQLLELARSSAALDPSVFDEHPPYFFGAEISSTRLDAYFTHMDPATTLPNYARDAAGGVSFLAAHNSRTLPFGRTLTGELLAGAELTRVTSDIFTIPGLPIDVSAFGSGAARTTDQLITAIRAGIQTDVSIGFYGGWFRCDVCGNDLMDWRMCSHIPGMRYEVKGADNVIREQLCTATVIDARLAEVSAVYEGATPGAVILKAQDAAERGMLGLDVARLVEQRYRIALPGRRLLVPGATVENERMTIAEQQGAAAAPAADPAAQPPAAAPAPDAGELAQLRALTTDLERMTSSLSEITVAAGAGERGLVEAVRWMGDELARLRPLADDGRAYREQLTGEVNAEGVRALGERYNAEQQQPILAALPLAQLRAMRDAYAEIARATLPAGRQTLNTAERQTPQTASTAPAAAFKD